MEIDRMSNLPGNIIDQILMRLPIKDAARTSVLSRNWKYKFAELPYLTIAYSDFLSTPDPKIAVDHILLLHLGPILKLKLEEFKDYDALDRWIIHLSRNHTKEFEIQLCDNYYKLPSCFFAWRSLTTLVCSHLSLALPSPFAGFANLKSLKLRLVDIEDDDLENLISGCPVLERLTLDLCCNFTHVKISAPNLKFLYIWVPVECLSFENTLCLAQVFLRYCIEADYDPDPEYNAAGNLVKFFAQLPAIRLLNVDFCFLEYLTTGVEPGKLPILCGSLESLGIEADLNDRADCLRALCLFFICQNITELTIKNSTISSKETYYWKDDYSHSVFAKLQYVEITGVNGTEQELDFLKFMLLNSPVLEKMVIRPADESIQLGLLKKLVTLRRISSRSQIICLDR